MGERMETWQHSRYRRGMEMQWQAWQQCGRHGNVNGDVNGGAAVSPAGRVEGW